MATDGKLIPLDVLLSTWSERLDTIARNLTDFNDSEEWRRIRAHSRDACEPAYVGKTLSTAQAIQTAVDGLWRDFLLVQGVVGDAVETSKKSGILSNTEAAARFLLEGASVRLPTAPAPVHVRDLLEKPKSEEPTTPAETLASMTNSFKLARDGVAAILDAQSRLEPRVTLLRDELVALRVRAKSAELEVEPFEALEFPTRDEIATDPLGAWDRLALAEQKITELESEIYEIESRIQTLRRKMPLANRRLANLKTLAGEATEMVRRCKGRVVDPNLSFDASLAQRVADAGQWLQVIEETLESGRWRAAAVGFAKWEALCDAIGVACKGTCELAQKTLGELEDLQGRLIALCAKGEKLQMNDAELTSTGGRACAALAQRPCRLTEARDLVDAYELALHLAQKSSRGGKGATPWD